MMKSVSFVGVLFLVILGLTGCAKDKELERLNREQARVIADLERETRELEAELNRLKDSQEDLARAKEELEKKLEEELAGGNLSVEMQERGLVVTVLDWVLFDSGRAELKESAKSTLDKVASVLMAHVPDHLVYVEGHTDNDPIRYSGWRSNWELSTARATEVIHYFTESQGLRPTSLVAMGYGQYHPVAPNDTPEGKTRNRRVEIVVSPKKLVELVRSPLKGSAPLA